MWKKIAIAGGVSAAVLGIGTAAIAASGSTGTSSPAGSGATSSTSPAGKPGATGKADKTNKHKGHDALKHALHGQWVTQGKDGALVTHDAIRGTVTAVSPTSIAVQSADKKSEVYTVTATTKVRIRTNGKGAKGAITAVHVGDKAAVLGTGTSTLTARGILDSGK